MMNEHWPVMKESCIGRSLVGTVRQKLEACLEQEEWASPGHSTEGVPGKCIQVAAETIWQTSIDDRYHISHKDKQTECQTDKQKDTQL